MSRPIVWPWLKPFIVLTLVVSVPPLTYWFVYVKHTVDAAKQQAHTTLAAVATNFASVLAANDRIAATIAPLNRKGGEAADIELPADKNKLEALRKVQQAQLQSVRDQLQSTLQTKELTVVDGRAALAVSAESGGLHWIVRAVSQTCALPSGCSLRAVVGLENLIPWQIVQPEFDGLLLLNEEGKLLAQDRRLPAQALGIRMSVMEGATALDYKAVLGVASASDAKVAEPGTSSPFDFHSDRSIQVAGVDYLVFLQPVTVPLKRQENVQAGATSLTFLVCGLLRKDRVRNEAIKLAPQTLALTTSLVALGLFAIPFLKLRFIGARERMRHRDMWFLCASLLCITALITLLMLDAHSRFKLHQRFDNGLRQFAAAVNGNVVRESNAAVAQLEVSAREMLDSIGLNGKDIKPLPECGSAVAIGSVLADSTVAKVSNGAFTYPDFEALYITDPCSVHWHKWMPRTIPTTNVESASLPFYGAAIALQKDQPFGFSSVIARTTGLQLAIYAQPLDLTTGAMGTNVEFSKRNSVAAIATQLRSVNEPVVPSPFQFVLVDRKGEVTFQQAQGPFHGERFFEVIGGGQALERTAFDNQRQAPEHLNNGTIVRREYRGHMYRMYAIEIPELQQSLVAYYDEANVDSLATRIFGTAAAFAAALIACILIGAALAVCWFGEHAHDWLWPTTSRASLYFVGCLLCLCTMVIIYLVRAISGSNLMAGLFVLAPIATMTALGSGKVTAAVERLVAALPLPTALHTQQWCRSRAYQTFVVTGLVALIAWPTALIVDDAFSMHTAAYARGVTNDLELATEKSLRKFVTATAINIGAPLQPINCTVKGDQRCILPEHIYASDSNYAKLLANRSDFGVYRNCVDLRNDELQTAGSCSLQPVPWSFTVGLANLLARFSSKPDLALIIANFSDSQSELSAPSLMSGFAFSKWTVGGFLLLVTVLCTLVGSVAKHVLGVGLATKLVLDESQQFAPAPQTQWLLLQPNAVTFDQAVKQATAVVDLRDTTIAATFVTPSEDATLLIHHLESRIASAECRIALLLLLGSTTQGCVVLSSEIDPLQYLNSRLCEAEDAIGAAEDAARSALENSYQELRKEVVGWSLALRRVHKIRTLLQTPPDIKPWEQASNAVRLTIECASTESLLEIRQRLLAVQNIDSYCWDDVVGFVLDAAEPYYRSLWELCSHEERLVLIQLAQEGLVNPKRIEIIQRLARRNLVIIDSRFKLMNESFRRFVRTVETPERIADWERTPANSAWSRLGAPLYALATVIIAILLFTEQEMFTSIIAVATGAAGTLGSMRNLYTSTIKPVTAIVKNA
jgi:hypothetical protein